MKDPVWLCPWLLCLLLGLALSGCSAREPADQVSPASEPRRAQRELRRPLPERVEPPTEPAVTGEVPADLIEVLVIDLLERTGTGRNDMTLVRAEEVIWPDGSLGCPRPDTTYPQAPVEGFRVVMEVAGLAYDYRVTRNGSFFLCQSAVAGTGLTPPARPTNR